MEPQQKIEIDNIGIKTIGFHKYNHLKSKPSDQLTDEEKKQIEAYEIKKHVPTEEDIQKTKKYMERITQPKEKVKTISAAKISEMFKQKFQEVNGRPFIKIEGVTVDNMMPLIYYFAKDERFFKCKNLSDLSEPSFDKGLLIIGNFGNGKTAAMKVFESMFTGIPGFNFKGYTANGVVTMFEKCTGDNASVLKKEFETIMWNGTRYFDDLKTEREASNFGKVNIFKEILEERYQKINPETGKRIKTYVTCNFKEGFEDDIQAAVDEFEDKYGGRVYDRLFEMFNIIVFNGKSFRR